MNDGKLKEIVDKITREYIAELQTIPVGVSNRHVHLSKDDMDKLFGRGSALHPMKELRQPGQYAAEETVDLRGPNGSVIPKVRVLGPIRPESQVEISAADSFKLGAHAPVRESGELDGTPGIELIGPLGSIKINRGLIVAWRHIHLSEESARFWNVHDRELVFVESDGPRGCILKNVLVRVSQNYRQELHVDTEEANTTGLKNGDIIKITKYGGQTDEY